MKQKPYTVKVLIRLPSDDQAFPATFYDMYAVSDEKAIERAKIELEKIYENYTLESVVAE